jgi:diaminohydroxyphosphoribosylaminopyrimidine deaminase/5-amino-6-(5-phosphoribosylamino)uracil reductase
MVGAVIVKNGDIVGEGYHEAVGKAHAEINAINDAGSKANGADMYVTLEPCNHIGRTPPCTEKVLEAGIKRVVVAMPDPNPDVKGGGIGYLQQHGIDVKVGVLRRKAINLNEAFIKYSFTKRPFVTVKCAVTLDGRIATRTGDAKWVSGVESRKMVHLIRHASDAIMVGRGTVIADDPHLTTRLENGSGVDPLRVVLDTKLSIPEDARILRQDSDSDTVVVTGDTVSEKKIHRLEKAGARIITMPLKNGRIDLNALMAYLGQRGIASLLIEGGASVTASAFKEEIVDKAIFFFAPKILGGDDGVPVCRGSSATRMQDSIPVKDILVQKVGEDVMIEGYLHNVNTWLNQ